MRRGTGTRRRGWKGPPWGSAVDRACPPRPDPATGQGSPSRPARMLGGASSCPPIGSGESYGNGRRDPGPRSTDRSSVIRVGHPTPTYAFRPRICSNRADRRGGTMEYTHLGRLGLLVSRLCLGTMNFGPETSEEDSHAIMDRALEHGINFFDTANVYGRSKGVGTTEQ